MGTAFAKKLASLECKVIGYDKYNHAFESESIQEVSLEELFLETEILSIHVPLTDETRYLFDRKYLSEFKNLKIVVNTSRGKILDLAALVELLEEKEIYGAALDVLENEKPETYSKREKELMSRLVSHPNVLVSPHVGGWSFESYHRINEVLIEKLKNAFRN